MTPDPIRLPDLDDPDLGPFWRGIARGELVAQRCEDCGTLRFPPLPVCDNCLSERAEWVPVSRNGTIWSYVRYFRAFHPAFSGDIPYVVVMVENEDGLVFVGNIDGPDATVTVGAPVSAVFAPVTADLSVLKWRIGPDRTLSSGLRRSMRPRRSIRATPVARMLRLGPILRDSWG